jgi:hypothetical protein
LMSRSMCMGSRGRGSRIEAEMSKWHIDTLRLA